MCYDDKKVDEAVCSIFGARVMLHFGTGSHSLDQCQNWPVCLCEHKYTAENGKAVFRRAFSCNDQPYDLVLNIGVIAAIADKLGQHKLIKNPPEIKVPTGRRVLDPAYIKLSVSA